MILLKSKVLGSGGRATEILTKIVPKKSILR